MLYWFTLKYTRYNPEVSKLYTSSSCHLLASLSSSWRLVCLSVTGEKLRRMTGKKSLNWFNINIFTPSKPHACCTASPATSYTVCKKTQHSKKPMTVHVLRIKISNECHKHHLGTKVKTMGSNSIQNTHPSMVANWRKCVSTQPLYLHRLSKK